MRISIRLFGPLRDRFGPPDQRAVELAAPATVEGSLAALGWLMQVQEAKVAVAVNGEIASRDRVLADGDLVDLLPPVAGG